MDSCTSMMRSPTGFSARSIYISASAKVIEGQCFAVGDINDGFITDNDLRFDPAWLKLTKMLAKATASLKGGHRALRNRKLIKAWRSNRE
jgi:hypothetical protein